MTLLTDINEIIDKMKQTYASWPRQLALLVTLVAGLALLLWGYRLFRVWLTAFGLLCGYYAGQYMGQKAELEGWPALAITVLLALAGAILFWLAIKLSVFLAAFFLGLYFMRYFSVSLFGYSNLWVYLAAALTIAILAVFFLRFFIIAATAWSGARLIVDSLYGLIAGAPAGSWLKYAAPLRQLYPTLLFVLLLVLIAMGFIYQYHRSGHGRRIRLHGYPLRSR
ncbi:MAG: hypothetical protein PHR21_04905 [Oscillospiraceae bacterium]|nr:hypothetical protein [Oscillospiraceae bacterium]MDD4367360.1 hypothetical protein [Oscillospiraceae bacterium]